MNLPGEQSLTLPSRGRKNRPSLDDSALNNSYRSPRSSRSSVTSQEGYLENMFRKECEVDDRMNDIQDDIAEESEDEYDGPRRRSAQAYHASISSHSSRSSRSNSESNSDSEDGITLPKVRLKKKDSAENSAENSSVNSAVEVEPTEYEGQPISELESDAKEEHSAVSGGAPSTGSNMEINNGEHSDEFNENLSPSEYTSELDRIIARENSRTKSNTLNSQGTSDGQTSTHTSSSSIGYQGKSAAQRAFERGSSDSMSGSRRRISPQEDFSFTSQVSTDETRTQRKKTKSYTKG